MSEVSNDVAVRWGLPSGFRPVVAPVPDELKELLREMLSMNEPVVASIGNEGDTIFLVATTERLFSARRGATAGITGWTIKEYPWPAIADLKMQSASLNVRITISFHSRDGRKVEMGKSGKQWKLHQDALAPFETSRGSEVFEAIQSIWVHKTSNV